MVALYIVLGLSLSGNIALYLLTREQAAFIKELKAEKYDPLGEYGPPTWNPFKR